jgi:hypothetical protein
MNINKEWDEQGMTDNNTITIEEEKRASKKSENIEDTLFH